MSTASQRALVAVEKDPTHTVYTPVWRPEIDGGKFYKWLPVGCGWREDNGGFELRLDSEPINAEETATSYLKLVSKDAPPPAPLTISREEFIEGHYSFR